MSKRVCLVRHNYYPDNVLVQREALALRDYGFEVDVICLRGRQQLAAEVMDGIHVIRLPLRRVKAGAARYIYDYLSFFILAGWILTVRFLRYRYQFIQVNSMPDFLVFVTLLPRLLGAKVMLQMYEPTPELWAARQGLIDQPSLAAAPFAKRFTYGLLRKIEQWSLCYPHAVFTVTQQLKDNYVTYGANPHKITVILNAPEARLFSAAPVAPAPAAADPTRFVLISHGAIEERYGHDTMLQAIAELKDTIPGLELRITGAGSYLQEFLAQIEALKIQDHVKYLGYVSWEELMTELSQADVGIVAQKSSLYSNLVHTCKMYDFMAFNKPVIASRLRAVEAYFDEESLGFFAPGDAHDLARVILELYRDPEKRRSLVAHAGDRYQQYCWEQQRKLYWEGYARLERGQA